MSTKLHPVKEVQVGGSLVEVRELPAIKLLAFVKEVAGFFAQMGSGLTDAEGNLRINFDQLPKLIAESAELAESLILKATGMDTETFAELMPEEFLDLLDAALELNLKRDFFDRLGVLARKHGEALGLMKPSVDSRATSPSSSASGSGTPTG